MGSDRTQEIEVEYPDAVKRCDLRSAVHFPAIVLGVVAAVFAEPSK